MIKFIDLFCGLGGFRIALESCGCECVFSSDIDKHARETYKENFGDYPHGDITKINEKEIPDHDILCAGFPCQPFSIGGKRKGFEDTRGTLFFDVLRILKEKRPRACILENVSGICSHDNGKTIEVILNSLKEIGYTPFYKIINAKDVGYPQNRSRWYCVCLNVDYFKEVDNNFVFPFPKKQELKFTVDSLLDNISHKEYKITNTCEENINMHLNMFINKGKYDKNHILIANEIRKSRCNFRCDGICPCLTAKMGTGGNNIPVIVDNKRKLTEKECLLIMGYPKEYKIKKNSYQSYKQIGNSVVVPIIEEISKELVKMLK